MVDGVLKAKFLKIFANIPENIRSGDIIAVIDNRPFTWNNAAIEIKNDTVFAKQIIKKLKELGIL